MPALFSAITVKYKGTPDSDNLYNRENYIYKTHIVHNEYYLTLIPNQNICKALSITKILNYEINLKHLYRLNK